MRLLIKLSFIVVSIAASGQTDYLKKVAQGIDSQEHLSGALLVGQNGKIIYQEAFGQANYTFGSPNSVDSKFLIGSLTKQFTAMLVMQQVEIGNLNLDDKVTKYLQDFRKETGDRITLRHLLTHTHGIQNANQSERYKPMTKSEFIKKYCETDLEFEPGTQFKYSDIVGYYLLGAILEQITRTEYDKLLVEKIFKPIGMQNTGYFKSEIILSNLSTGYSQTDKGIRNAPYWDISQSFSAAGLYSTVNDLFLWDQALRTNKLVSEKTLKIIFSPYTDKIRYGFGWFINDPEINGAKRILAGHTGGANGYRSQIMRGLDDDLVVIYLSNTDRYVELRYPVIDAVLTRQ